MTDTEFDNERIRILREFDASDNTKVGARSLIEAVLLLVQELRKLTETIRRGY